jgi:tetratricopeptide (TPR) repeat protein
LDRPFPSYQGSEPFAFVCYSHSDAETVYADLAELDRNGLHFWYDEGIQAGTSWRAEIAAAIKGASKFLFFISAASLKSTHCLREVDYALSHDIEIIPVYLDDSDLPGELELVLNRVHALFRSTDSMYLQHLTDALRGSKGRAPLRRPAKKRKRSGLVIAAAVGVLMVFALVWTLRDSGSGGGRSDAATVVAPSAFDRYLEGLELMERWDKGDNLATATGLFREATTLDPEFALAYARLAEALRMQYALSGDEARLEEAAGNAQEAVRLNPGLAPVQVALGRVYAAQGNIDLAFAAAQRAVAIDPNDAGANQAIAGMYASLGRLQDAEASFQKAIALDPDNLLSLDGYANFLFAQSRFEEAAQQWQAVIRLAPDHYAALVNLGSALNESGRVPEAITMFQRAIEIQPTYMAYVNLGNASARAQQYADAVAAFRQALDIDDSDWLAWGNLAYVYSWMNGMDEQTVATFEHAIGLAESAKQQNPRDPFIYSDLALYYAKTGQPELALQRVGTAITLSPLSGEILAAAAEAYELIGQRDKAIELARQSLENGFPRGQLQRNHELSGLLEDPRMQGSL